jgi:hypothetical protein
MVPTLLVTPTRWWLLLPDEINTFVRLADYLKNTGDGLELNKSLLTELKRLHYPYTFDHVIETDKKTCKHQEINRIIYDVIKARLASPAETEPSA